MTQDTDRECIIRMMGPVLDSSQGHRAASNSAGRKGYHSLSKHLDGVARSREFILGDLRMQMRSLGEEVPGELELLESIIRSWNRDMMNAPLGKAFHDRLMAAEKRLCEEFQAVLNNSEMSEGTRIVIDTARHMHIMGMHQNREFKTMIGRVEEGDHA